MKFKKFLIEFRMSEKIPEQDKKVLLLFLIASVLPALIIPGWISVEGFFISFFIFSFVPDYLFNVLDQTLLLSFYPYDMKSYNSLKRAGKFITMFTPSVLAANIWQYKKDVI